MSFRTSATPRTEATTTSPFRVRSLLASMVADLKSFPSKGRRSSKSPHSRTHLLAFPFNNLLSSKALPRALSPYSDTESDSDDDAYYIMGIKSEHTVSRSVIGRVKSIPRMASRLACVSGAGHSPVEATFSAFKSDSSSSSRSATIISASSSGGSGKGSVLVNDVPCLKASKASLQTPAATSAVDVGPIITVQNLKAALSDSSDIEFQSSFGPDDVVASPGLVLNAPKPRVANAKGLSILSNASLDVPEPQRDDDDVIPLRTLSPRPELFRHRVHSNASRPTSPYTSPLNSPSASPMPEKQHERKFTLHGILSSDDLVAPRRLKLYAPDHGNANEGSGSELRRVMSN